MSDPYIAQIAILPYDFAPRDWAFCQGQMMSVDQQSALFGLIGTLYGGDGQTSVGLPDFRGRLGIQAGGGPGTWYYNLGLRGGEEQYTLYSRELPSHTHDLTNEFGPNRDSKDISDHYLSHQGPFYQTEHDSSGNLAGISGNVSGSTGGGQSHENRMPYQVLNFCIAISGLFPARN